MDSPLALWVALLAVVLLLSATFFGLPLVRSSPVIVATGDSLTSGVRWTDVPYPSQLGEMLGVRIINEGVSRDTTAQMLSRFDRVESYHPAFVLIMGGHNDLGIHDADTTIANLKEMYDRAALIGSKVIALTIPPCNESPDDMEAVNSWILGQLDSNIIPVDVFTSLAINGTSLLNPLYDSGDHVHLNNAGYKVIARQVFDEAFNGTPFASVQPDHYADVFEVSSVVASFSIMIAIVLTIKRQ